MIYALLYILCMGFSTVLLQKAGFYFSPSLTLVFGSLIALCYFNLINFRYIAKMYRACYQHRQDVLLINIYVFIIWLASVYGAVYAGASLFAFLFFGSLGATSRVFEYWQHKKPIELLSLFLIVGLLAVAIYLNIHNQVSVNMAKGVLCGIGGGVVGYFYLKLSGTFMKQCDLKATQILALRFYLAIALGWLFIPKGAVMDLTPINLGLIFLITCFNMMIPLYFSQKSVQTIGSEITSSIISCLPLATAAIEFVMIAKVPGYNIFIYVLYALLVGLPYIHLHRKKRGAHEDH